MLIGFAPRTLESTAIAVLFRLYLNQRNFLSPHSRQSNVYALLTDRVSFPVNFVFNICRFVRNDRSNICIQFIV